MISLRKVSSPLFTFSFAVSFLKGAIMDIIINNSRKKLWIYSTKLIIEHVENIKYSFQLTSIFGQPDRCALAIEKPRFSKYLADTHSHILILKARIKRTLQL